MKAIVFECRKCEGRIKISNSKDLVSRLDHLSKKDCPFCGEEPYRNWLLAYVQEEEDE